MINILVADDSREKENKIKKVLDGYFADRQDVCIDYVQDVVNAKNIMAIKNIDILILDLYLPVNFENGIDARGGITLIKQIYKSVKYRYPDCVISLSQHKDAMKEFKKETCKVHRAIYYDAKTSVWQEELIEVLDFVIPCIVNNADHRCYKYDIAVITALEEELKQIKDLLNEVKVISYPMDDSIYFEGILYNKEHPIHVIASSAMQMGMVAAATLTTRIIHNFVPKYIVMTGIAAGIKKHTNLGDAVVASFSWDYGAGKEIVADNGFGRHLNSFLPVSAEPGLLSKVKRLQLDKQFLNDIADGFNGQMPDTKFKIVIGPMATGAAVIANPEKIQEIINNQNRDVVAVEMEAYGMYYAAEWAIEPKPGFLAIKSICDYADQKKDDDYHNYAIYTSVKVFEKLATEYFQY